MAVKSCKKLIQEVEKFFNDLLWRFQKVDLRLGVVVQVELFERAKNSIYKVWIDFSDEIKTKKCQLKNFY